MQERVNKYKKQSSCIKLGIYMYLLFINFWAKPCSEEFMTKNLLFLSLKLRFFTGVPNNQNSLSANKNRERSPQV